MKKHKIVIAVSGASGAIYAKVLFDKLIQLNNQIIEIGVLMSDNAKYVWQTELGNNRNPPHLSRATISRVRSPV